MSLQRIRGNIYTLKFSLARTLSAKTSVIILSNVDRIFMASWGSMRPSLIRSSRVSVRERPRLHRKVSQSVKLTNPSVFDSYNIPAPPVKFIIRLSAHRGGVPTNRQRWLTERKLVQATRRSWGVDPHVMALEPADWLVR